MTDKNYMQLAIDLSSRAKYPYGAVLALNGEVIGHSDYKCDLANSAFAHAELIAIQQSIDAGVSLKGAKLYSSCEPCAMCMGAIMYHGISELYFGCSLEDSSRYVTDEVPISAESLAKMSPKNIQISPRIEYKAAVEVMKNWREDNQ